MKKNEMVKGKLNMVHYLLVFVLAVIPFIVHVKIIQIANTEYLKIWDSVDSASDVFSYYKAVVFCVITGIASVITFFKKGHKIHKSNKNLLLAILGITIILSFVLSDIKQIALWGAVERFEGTIVWISYILIYLIASFTVLRRETMDTIIKCFLISAIVMSIIGFLQMVGLNVLFLPPFKQIIFGSYANAASEVIKGMAFATLYNPNYVGSYCSIAMPLSIYYYMRTHDRTLSAVSFFMLGLLLYASKSDAGIVGLVCAGVFVLINLVLLSVNQRKNVMLIIVGITVLISLSLVFSGRNQVMSFFDPSNNTDYKKEGVLKKYEVDADGVGIVNLDNQELHLRIINRELWFLTSDNKKMFIKMDNKTGIVTFPPNAPNLNAEIYIRPNEVMVVHVKRIGCSVFFGIKNNQIYLSDLSGNNIELGESKRFGFYGYDKVGSSRGYIWSRTIPLLKNHIFYGAGADCYPNEFQQNDPFAKAYALGNSSVRVDKPHNLYLQLGVNFGLVALIAYLLFMILGIIEVLKLAFIRRDKTLFVLAAVIVSWMVTSLFNDSTVHVTPIMWCIYGMIAGIIEHDI